MNCAKELLCNQVFSPPHPNPCMFKDMLVLTVEGVIDRPSPGLKKTVGELGSSCPSLQLNPNRCLGQLSP